jgi:glycine cleavage system transcriptional repressor
MRHFALSAIGRDRPGIVAAVTEVLLEHDVNIEDSHATILRGHFTMMFVLEVPGGSDVDDLRRDLEGVHERLGLDAVALSPLAEVDPATDPVPSHIVTLYGADHPGIVHAATAVLGERGVDVTDLTTKLAGEGRSDADPLYALMMEVAVPEALDADELRRALEQVGSEQGVEVSLRSLEQDAL